MNPRLLITAGPTHEPIDAVRYLANRSSGKLGIALADAATDLGWPVRLLLGPTPLSTRDSRLELHRFRTTADLQALLARHLDWCDILIMAAAVADYRPAQTRSDDKLRRADQPLTLHLEPTPDLLAECSRRRRSEPPRQTLVGFALEPRDRLLDSARSKLARKGLDFIVANPLETMDAESIKATVLAADGSTLATPEPMPKTAFARWLLDVIARSRATGSSLF